MQKQTRHYSQNAGRTVSNYCPPGMLVYNGQCYAFVKALRTWFEAREYCQNAYAAELLRIDTQQEREFVQSMLMEKIPTNSMYDPGVLAMSALSAL